MIRLPLPRVLLHGALGSAAQMKPLAERLSLNGPVHTWDFPGHGGGPVPEDGYDMAFLAECLAGYLEGAFNGPVPVFGYSMGGYVAAAVAARFPGRIASLVTLGTKWEWDPLIADQECKMLDPDVLEAKAPALVTLIGERHAPNSWRQVIHATSAMLRRLGHQPLLTPDILSGIRIPVTILRGEADRMVTASESRAVADSIPHARYFELPGQKHPFEQTDLNALTPLFGE